MFKKVAYLCCLLLALIWAGACGSSTDLGKPCTLSDKAAQDLKVLQEKTNPRIVEATFQCDIGYCLGTDYVAAPGEEKVTGQDKGYCSVICQTDADCPRGEYQYTCQKFLDLDADKLPENYRESIRPLLGRSLCVRVPKSS